MTSLLAFTYTPKREPPHPTATLDHNSGSNGLASKRSERNPHELHVPAFDHMLERSSLAFRLKGMREGRDQNTPPSQMLARFRAFQEPQHSNAQHTKKTGTRPTPLAIESLGIGKLGEHEPGTSTKLQSI